MPRVIWRKQSRYKAQSWGPYRVYLDGVSTFYMLIPLRMRDPRFLEMPPHIKVGNSGHFTLVDAGVFNNHTMSRSHNAFGWVFDYQFLHTLVDEGIVTLEELCEAFPSLREHFSSESQQP